MIPDITIVFTIDGKTLHLRFKALPLSVWSELKRHLAFTPVTLLNAISDMDVEAFAALIWLERKQHDRRLTWAEVQRELESAEVAFDFVDALVDGVSQTGAAPGPAEVDPTPAG